MNTSEDDIPAGLEEQDEPNGQQGRNLFPGAADATLLKFTAPPPQKLYHYTSADGLLGIVSDNNFRFSDTRFLNDGSENYTAQHFAAEAIKAYREENPQIPNEISEGLARAIMDAFNMLIPVVFCMSEQNNLLNQWRDYGKDVVPYSIEIDTSDVQDKNKNKFPVFLEKVVYDPEVMLEMCRDFFSYLHKSVDERYSQTAPTQQEQQLLYESAAFEFVRLSLCFKNPTFAAEQEWRMVTTAMDLRNAGIVKKYRSSSLGVVPFFEWGRKDDSVLPITKVTVGPSPYSRVSDLALKEFLFDNGYDCETFYSTIPIRR